MPSAFDLLSLPAKPGQVPAAPAPVGATNPATIRPKPMGPIMAPAMRAGKLDQVDDSEIEFEPLHQSQMYTETSNLVPLSSTIKGARLFLTSKYYSQSMPMAEPEAPLVDSLDEESGQGWSATLGRRIGHTSAPVDGVVKSVGKESITLAAPDGQVHTVGLNYFTPANRKTSTTDKPLVKPGDKVLAGQPLAHNNYVTPDGQLAMGKTLRVGFVAGPDGSTFEDGIAVSERAAQALKSSHLYGYDVEAKRGVRTDKAGFISYFPNRYTNEQLAKFNADGHPIPGVTLEPGDPVLLAYAPRTLRAKDAALGSLHKVMRNSFQDLSQTWDKLVPGNVTDSIKARNALRVNVAADMPLRDGDKMCYSPEHDVLTRNGWKAIGEVSMEDEICSMDPETQEIEYLRPEAINGHWYSGKMYFVDTTQISMCVTPNHNIWASPRNPEGAGYSFHKPEEVFGKRYRLSRFGDWTSGVSPKQIVLDGLTYSNGCKGMRTSQSLTLDIESYMKLLGIWVSEGSATHSVSSGTYGVKITQTKPHTVPQIQEMLDQAGITYQKIPDGFLICHMALHRHLKQFGTKCWNKLLPREVFGYSRDHQRILLDWLVMGDGSVDEKSMLYFTSSRQLAEDVQELAFLCGYTGRLQIMAPGTENSTSTFIYDDGGEICGRTIKSKRVRYVVHISRKKLFPQINHGHAKRQSGQTEAWIDYDGPIFCATLPKHHLMYVRREGKCHWSGNSNRFGAKGVVAKVFSNDQMMHDAEGNPLDVLINPAALIGRVNPGMIYEALLGKIAKKTGKQYVLPSFSDESFRDFTENEIRKHGVVDKEDLFDPISGRKVPQVLTGLQYFHKMEHTSDGKLSGRGGGGEDDFSSLDDQPGKGGSYGGKRVGALQIGALLSHRATNVIQDAQLNRGSANPEMWVAIRSGRPLPSPKVPFIFNKFLATLNGAGIRTERKGDNFNILAMTDKDVMKMAKHPIDDASTLDLKTGMPVSGGLFDHAKFGGPEGTDFARIDLDEAIPNPLMEDPIRSLLGLTKDKFRDVLAGREVFQGQKGPQAIGLALDGLDLDRMEQDARAELRSGRKAKRSNAIKQLGFIAGLKKGEMTPSDLMISKVPVLPPTYRPISIIDGLATVSDPNYLYRDILHSREALRSNRAELPDEELGDERLAIYDSVRASQGLGEPVHPELVEKGVKGFLKTITGTGGPKSGLFMSKVVSHPVNTVGRSVAIPDSSLNMDEIGMPEEMAWRVFSPFTIGRMARAGMNPAEATKHVSDRTPLAKRFLLEEMPARPVMLSRDPALHRYNIMGAHAVIRPGSAIAASPLIVKGFNLDFDGDQVNVHVPVSSEAIKDIREKMMPSKNLFAIKNKKIFYQPSQEFVLGIASASQPNKKKPTSIFAKGDDALAAYHRGELDMDSPIEIPD